MFSINKLLSMTQKKEIMKSLIALPGATLSAEEAERFITYVWDQSVLKNNARKVVMESATKNIRGIGLTTRILKPASTFSQSDYLQEFSDNLIQLNSKHFRAAVVIFDTDLEDVNVGTPEEFKSALMNMVTAKLANEIEEICWIGDTHSLSGFGATDARSLVDGWRYQLDHSQASEDYVNDVTGSAIILDASNTVTAKVDDFDLTVTDGIAEQSAAAPYLWEYKYSKMLQYMPSVYKRLGLANFRFFNSDQITDNYMAALEARGVLPSNTGLDAALPEKYRLVPIVSMPLMPTTMKIDTTDAQKEALKSDGTMTDALLTWNQNLVVGIQREIKVEPARSAADEATIFFYSLRMDVAIEDIHGCVFLKRLLVV